jgi:hypothetical protein
MAQASKMQRKLRRFKRERTLAMRMADLAIKQRNQARFIAGALEEQLKKTEAETFKADPLPEASAE